jgi:iron complex transport system ATP-binding protein
VLTRVLGDNIRLDITTGGVRVAVPASLDPATDRPAHSPAKPLTTDQEKRVV